MSTDHLLPYERNALSRRLAVGGSLAQAAGAGYVSGGAALLSSSSALPVDTYLPGFDQAAGLFRLGAGGMAVLYGVKGVRTLAGSPWGEDKKTKRLRQIQGGASLVAGLGLAAQAFGAGPWAGIVAGTGAAVSTGLSIWRTMREEP